MQRSVNVYVPAGVSARETTKLMSGRNPERTEDEKHSEMTCQGTHSATTGREIKSMNGMKNVTAEKNEE